MASLVGAGTQPLVNGSINAQIWRNDVLTSYTDTGVTNPAALRISPVVQSGTYGDVEASLLMNEIHGTPKYTLMIHGGPGLARSQGPYSGTLNVDLYGTRVAEEAQ